MHPQSSVPTLFFDGSFVDVLWDNHDAAVKWFETYMGWSVQQQELWKPDPRCTAGKMTQMNWGTWLVSSISNVRLPHHYAERGTVESNVRLCWRTSKLQEVHEQYKSNGIRVSEIYAGSGNTKYFDYWATCEGIRFTAQQDDSVASNGFVPSWNRIGVSEIKGSVEWYKTYMGMEVDQDYSEHGYVIMKLSLNHRPDQYSYWVLEQCGADAYFGKVDAQVRLSCWVRERDAFFQYHQHLINSGIEISEIGGFMTQGLVSFHMYDPDGNRMNISSV